MHNISLAHMEIYYMYNFIVVGSPVHFIKENISSWYKVDNQQGRPELPHQWWEARYISSTYHHGC